jgi:uncharacterized membrane protein YcaP (DUF421 family)
MDAVLRATLVYSVLLLLFRISGKRTLAQTTTFDFVLLLIIGEATQQGLIGDDFSVTKALLLVTTLLGIDIGISLLQGRVPKLGLALEGAPLVILEEGEPIRERLKKARVEEDDILEAGRLLHGIEQMSQMKFAILERNGAISIIPKSPLASAERSR